jgi:HTH-type transcriptional regulator / antitoxin HigA
MSSTIASRASRGKRTSEDYINLVRELPIRPLKTQKEYAAAQRVLDRLVGREDLTTGEVDYVAGLARFVEDYERQHRMGQLGRLSSVELLRHLMEENDMNTSDLGEVLGSRGLASEVLNGKRGLSKMLIAKLAERFRLEPALFFNSSHNGGA